MKPAGLPGAVTREVAAAEEIQRMLAAAEQRPPAPPPPQLPPQPVATSLADAIATPAPTPPAPAAPAPLPTPPMTPPAPPQPVVQQPSQGQEVVQQLMQQNQLLATRLSEALGRITDLTTTLTKQTAATPAATGLPPGVDAADTKTFGDDVIGLVHRMISATAAQFNTIIGELRAEITTLKGSTQQANNRAEYTVEQLFVMAMDRGLPNWREVNADQRWRQWLMEADPFTGKQRQELLNEATGVYNADRTLAIFKAWMASVSPPATAPVPPQPQNELAALVTPASAAPAAAPTPAEIPYIKESEVQSFYNSVALNRFKGSPQDKERITAVIDQAAAAGRILIGQ